MNARTLTILLLSALTTLATSGCGKEDKTPLLTTNEPVGQERIAASAPLQPVILGKQIGEDKKVTAASTTFAPGDTIHASVTTAGTGKAALKAVWTYRLGEQATLVNETVQEIDAMGATNTEFHISKVDGWPIGNYRVEIFLNNVLTGRQDYSVQ